MGERRIIHSPQKEDNWIIRETMLKSYLLENYGYNEQIFLNDLKIEELSENAVRQSVKRLVANGFLERYDNGIYYIPKQDGLLGKSYLNPVLVIMRKYVRNESETYGYVTGMTFANQWIDNTGAGNN